MPEFILELGTPQGARTFAGLDAFTRGYIEALFFTNASDPDDGLLSSATFADLAAETLTRIVRDCAAFQEAHRADLDEGIDTGRINGYDDAAAGRDLWFTRCGHGVGFWDRGLGDIGDTLTHHAHAFGSVDVYSGDDGRIYLS